MSGYRVVYVEPGKPAAEKEIGTKLEDIQEAVGGLIECVYPHGDRTVLVCNDEGKLLGMEGNRRLDNGSIIAGPFFVIGDAGEHFRSLTDAEVNKYATLLLIWPVWILDCTWWRPVLLVMTQRETFFSRKWVNTLILIFQWYAEMATLPLQRS